MFVLYAEKNILNVLQSEPVTSGSADVCPACFEFSADWDGLDRTAVFRAGAESRSVQLDGSVACAVPWEVLAVPGVHLFAGVYGTDGAGRVLPTIWANLGLILEGAVPGENARPPTPALWEQALAGKGDHLERTSAGELGLYAGAKLLSSVALPAGSGIPLTNLELEAILK